MDKSLGEMDLGGPKGRGGPPGPAGPSSGSPGEGARGPRGARGRGVDFPLRLLVASDMVRVGEQECVNN